MEGLRDRLLAPDLVAAYVRAYYKAWEVARDQAARAPLDRRRGELKRAIDRIVDAIADGTASKAVAARLTELEAELDEVDRTIAAMEAEAKAPPVAPHPQAAEGYRQKIAALHALLAASADRDDATRDLADAAGALVEKIEVQPRTQERGGPVDLVLFSRLEDFIARDRGEPSENRSMFLMVAGGGIEPPTCGL